MSSYLTGNPEELFDQAPQVIKDLIVGNDVHEATAILGKAYKIPISSYVAFENIISYLLLGAVLPENAIWAITDLLGLDEATATKLAQDLDTTILEKARIQILGKAPTDMVTLTFQEGRSPDELRKEILDTTKREPVPAKEQASAEKVPLSTLVPKPQAQAGTRSQLMEQLQIIGAIPNDEEVAERLRKIQEQVEQIKTKQTQKEEQPGSSLPIEIATPEAKAATYSRAPTHYNVDPYREVAE